MKLFNTTGQMSLLAQVHPTNALCYFIVINQTESITQAWLRLNKCIYKNHCIQAIVKELRSEHAQAISLICMSALY